GRRARGDREADRDGSAGRARGAGQGATAAPGRGRRGAQARAAVPARVSVAPATRIAMVRPFRGIVIRGVSPLRAEPDDDAELVDQAQYGEEMSRLGERGEWTY